MAAEEDDRVATRAATEVSQQGRSAGGQGTGPSSDPGVSARERRVLSHRPGLARQPDPLPDQTRHASLLIANPYCEVADPICRLPLPISVYRLEALHLGDRLRIWVRSGANAPRGPLLDFRGPR